VKVAIVGAGGHGRVAYDIFRLLHGSNATVVFFDDAPTHSEVLGQQVVRPVAALLEDPNCVNVFVAIGDNLTRAKITRTLLQAGKVLLTLVHPWTSVSTFSRIGRGTIAVAGTVVNAGAVVGDSVILNTHFSVGHDCRVEDFAQLGPGVNLGGGAVIGEGAFLGMGAKVAPNVSVGEWAIVGAGSVVLHEVPPLTFSYGTPARVVRELDSPERAPRKSDHTR